MHLENKKECIYHRLTQGVEEMEQEYGGKYSTKATLYFKDRTHLTKKYLGSYVKRPGPHLTSWWWVASPI